MSEHHPLEPKAQAKAQKDRQVRTELANKSEASDIEWLMSSSRGRRIVWRQLERAGVFRTSFNTNSMAMAFAEGAKNEGLRLLSMLPPESYVLMLKEAKE